MNEHKITDKEIVEHIKELKKLCKNENDKIFNYMKNGEVKKINEFTLNNYLHKYFRFSCRSVYVYFLHKNIIFAGLDLA